MKKIAAALTLLKDAAGIALSRWRTLLLQAGGLLAAALLFYALLMLPDSHIWTVAISAMAWPVLALGVLWLERSVFTAMLRPASHPSWKISVPLLLFWIALYVTAWLFLSHASDKFVLYASYLNSRLPAPGRAMLTYERIHGLFEDLYLILQWWLLPGLLLPCVVTTVGDGLHRSTWHRITSVWREWIWWLAIILLRFVGGIYTTRLLLWHPQRSAYVEVFSAVGRTTAIYLLDVALWYLLLSLLTACLLKANSAGGPEDSQRLTASKP